MSVELPAIDRARDARDVARAREGDRRALEDLLRRHADRVRLLCKRMLGNDADADDATQEALLAIVRGLRRFDGRASFTTWAYRVTTNACLDELRRRNRRPVATDDESLSRPVAAAIPLDDAIAVRLDIDAALARLPSEFRVAVVLRDLCQLDYHDIAELLEIPPGTVRSRIARGRAHLHRHLNGDSRPGNQQAATNRPNEHP